MELYFEVLFAKALGELIDKNGGSIETALDDMGISNEEQRNAIKEWFGWEDEDYEGYEFDGVCPYCGGQYCDWVDGDEDSDKYICRNCNEDFLFYVTDGTKHTRNGVLIVNKNEEDNEEENEEENEEKIKRLKYLLNKEKCCNLDKDEMYELQEWLDKYGYPSY